MTDSELEMVHAESRAASNNPNGPTIQPVCLIVIDGWGLVSSSWPEKYRKEHTHNGKDLLSSYSGNAIAHASTPNMSELLYSGNYPCVALAAHGTAVGLPDGLMGNSEVGHLNIGAGRIVYQDILRIDMTFQANSFLKNSIAIDILERAKRRGRLHLLGLVSDGGIHSHIGHLFGLLDAAKTYGVPKTFVHFFSDGRDTRPTSGIEFVAQLIDHLEASQYGVLATIVGRYYAMDRDKRWERIQVAYEALVSGQGETSDNPKKVGHLPYRMIGTLQRKSESQNNRRDGESRNGIIGRNTYFFFCTILPHLDDGESIRQRSDGRISRANYS
jgi:2,3-bisphosphoglycerate-independent phosphoglycerate mutase